MCRRSTFLLLTVILLSPLDAQYGKCVPGSRFSGGAGTLTACDGSLVVSRWINLQYGDYTASASPAIDIIGKNMANMLRIEMRSFSNGEDVRIAVNRSLSNGMIPVLMLWDQSLTCGDNSTLLYEMITEKWNSTDWKEVLQDEVYAPYLILNPVNEWSNVNTVTREDFRDVYIQVIRLMRSFGYTNLLSINAYHCGQYADSFSYIATDTQKMIGTSLLEEDANLIFSYHGYSTYWDSADKISSNFKNFQQLGFPWLMTEHGSLYGFQSDNVDNLAIWKTASELGVGVLAWSWHGNSYDPGIDLSYQYVPFSPTQYGMDVFFGTYGIRNTAFQCNCLNSAVLNTQAIVCGNVFYSQCGGSFFKGSTCCPEDSDCIYQSTAFSQCIPNQTQTPNFNDLNNCIMGNKGSRKEYSSSSSSSSDTAAVLSDNSNLPPVPYDSPDNGVVPGQRFPVPMWNNVRDGKESDRLSWDYAKDLEEDLKNKNRAAMYCRKVHIEKTKKRKFVNQYEIMQTIGKGSFGKVKLAKEKTSNKLLAVKVIVKSMLMKKRVFLKGRMTSQFENVTRELKIMCQLEHPNIIRLIEIIDDPNYDKLFIVMEYASKGSLHTGKDSKPIDPLKAKKYFKDLIKGLSYIHSLKIIHRDIKPENLLITDDDILKVADFGLSLQYQDHENSIRQNVGTAAFMAPEMCSSEIIDFGASGIDVWSAGVTLYLMIFGVCPFLGPNVPATYEKILKEPYFTS